MKRELKLSGFYEQAKDATLPLAGSNNIAAWQYMPTKYFR